jgi:2'-phosphotransferase
MSSNKKLYKFGRGLTRTLRHSAIDQGYDIDKYGYILVDDLLKGTEFTHDDIKTIVANDKKTRFKLTTRDGKVYIKANQGHSITVESDDYTVIKVGEYATVIHGTYNEFLKSISEEGLRRQTRNHIHMCSGTDAKSGWRANCEVLIHINIDKAINDGIVFYKSANDVILTEGLNGILDSKYFHTITNRNGETIR